MVVPVDGRKKKTSLPRGVRGSRCKVKKGNFGCIHEKLGAWNKKSCKCVVIGNTAYWKGVRGKVIVPVDGQWKKSGVAGRKVSVKTKRAVAGVRKPVKKASKRGESVAELRAKLKAMGLSTSGKKTELVARVREGRGGRTISVKPIQLSSSKSRSRTTTVVASKSFLRSAESAVSDARSERENEFGQLAGGKSTKDLLAEVRRAMTKLSLK